ncbi:MAG: serine/threonine-protein kinase [Vicinamibacteria bacterium]|nr:serine/threonine-protein kinase [Vicinamibacteria bacterium]
MSLASGTRLGPYEIVAAIGAGGMGEVLRARDTKLGREVAIKVLPAAFAQDAERVARFRREAQILASLNHPNIATIHGLEESEGTLALAMELVEGEDLSQRLKRGGGVPVDEAIEIARQVAEALEEAHEKGIVHRDLKPANVKVTADGKVKVLDFGLAKAFAADPMSTSGSHELSQSPTLATAAGTQAGVILGTAAYMSPEQARGKAVDRRADIWAFGVVLFEMLSGQRLFGGETVSDTLAAVLREEVPWRRLPAAVPAQVRQLLGRCLERDPKLRLQAIGEARVALALGEGAAARDAEATARVSWRGWRAWGPSLVAVVALIAAAAAWLDRPAPEPARVLQASLALPDDVTAGDSFALTPDGRRLVIEVWARKSGARSLWLGDLERGTFAPIEGTAAGELPFWSPDGQHVGFFAAGKLKRVDLVGGAARELADTPNPRGGTWGPDGRIVLAASFREGLSAVPASGGRLEPLTTLDAARGEKSHRFPLFLPGGRSLLFLAQSAEGGSRNDPSGIELLDLATGRRTRLVDANCSPLYSASGELLFWRDGTLHAQRFDAAAGSVSGEPVAIAAAVAYNQNEQALAAVSADGTLVYRPGTYGMLSRLIWVDRTGLGVAGIREGDTQADLAVSPDGKLLAISSHAPGQGGADIWLQDVGRSATTRLTFEANSESYPAWSGDSRHLYYASDVRNDGVLFRRRVDGSGTPEELGTTAAGLWPHAASRDGKFLVVGTVSAQTGFDLMRFDLGSRKLTPLVNTPFTDNFAALSPDDRLLAYTSDQSGRPEIYVQAIDGESGRWQISTDGGRRPRWRGDGRELLFLAPPDRVMSVDVTPGAVPGFSTPRELFRFPAETFDVAPDGQRFAVSSIAEGNRPLVVVRDWRGRMDAR